MSTFKLLISFSIFYFHHFGWSGKSDPMLHAGKKWAKHCATFSHPHAIIYFYVIESIKILIFKTVFAFLKFHTVAKQLKLMLIFRLGICNLHKTHISGTMHMMDWYSVDNLKTLGINYPNPTRNPNFQNRFGIIHSIVLVIILIPRGPTWHFSNFQFRHSNCMNQILFWILFQI